MNFSEYFHIVFIVGFTLLVTIWYAKAKIVQNTSKKHTVKDDLLAELKGNQLYNILSKLLPIIFIMIGIFVAFTFFYWNNEVNTIINNAK